MRSSLGISALFVLALVVGGCSKGSPTASVEGVVTLDGKPLGDVRVTFQPEGGGSKEAGMGSSGVTDASGKFSLRLVDGSKDGAVVAKHMVTFSDTKAEAGATDSDAGPAASGPKSRIPTNITGQTFEVKAGQKNEAKFELKSKP